MLNQSFFSDINRIGSNIWTGLPDRIGPDYSMKILDWIRIAKISDLFNTSRYTSTVQASEQRVVWRWKSCTLMYRFHEFGNCCSCLSWSWCCEL